MPASPATAVYDEQIYDLLRDPYEEPTPLPVKSTGEGFEVVGHISKLVRSSRELMELVVAATELRTVSSNNVHEHSSRSHAFLSLSVEQQERESFEALSRQLYGVGLFSSDEAQDPKRDPKKASGTDAETKTTTRLLLVDLAGSETYDVKEPHVKTRPYVPD